MGRIVVGVDGSDGAHAALEWAIEAAKVTGATVDAVQAWHLPYMGGATLVPLSGLSVDPTTLESSYRHHLEKSVAEVTASVAGSDDVAVRCVLVHGFAASTLLEASEGADLLVVGSRGMGGFKGLLVGSVTHQVIGHAPCPVVVIPPSAQGD